MKKLFAVALLSLCVTSAFSGEEQITRLTTNMLEQATIQMEEAGNNQDLKTLLAYLASDVVITVSFPKHPELRKLVFSKQTYATHLTEGWAITRDASIQRLKTEYKISADGKSATATSTFRQKATDKATGQTFTSSGKQVGVIELTDGIPKTTKIDATLSYRLDPSKRIAAPSNQPQDQE